MRWALVALLVPSLAFAQIEPSPEIDPAPERNDGEYEPDFDGEGTRIDGDLNSNSQNSNNGNISKTYNGAGSSGMPATTAIAPSLMSNGQQSC